MTIADVPISNPKCLIFWDGMKEDFFQFRDHPSVIKTSAVIWPCNKACSRVDAWINISSKYMVIKIENVVLRNAITGFNTLVKTLGLQRKPNGRTIH